MCSSCFTADFGQLEQWYLNGTKDHGADFSQLEQWYLNGTKDHGADFGQLEQWCLNVFFVVHS